MRIVTICSGLILGGAVAFITSYSVSAQPSTGPVELKLVTQQQLESAPFDSVCHSGVTRRRGVFRRRTYWDSSGALLPSKTLLTAAHNYYDWTFSKVEKYTVKCGYSAAFSNGARSTTGELTNTQNVRTESRYKRKFWAADYALVRLADSVHNSSFRRTKDYSLVKKGSIVHVAGYPINDGDPLMNGKNMFYAKGVVTAVEEEEFTYKVNTHGGLSGAPVWMEVDGAYVIVGIHVAIHGHGKAKRLTADSEAYIDKWIALLKP